MSDLERALDEFREAMLHKFLLRAPKHGKDSVHLDGNLDRLNPLDIQDHLGREMFERLMAGNSGEKMDEDVDVANLAFLDWYLQRQVVGA